MKHSTLCARTLLDTAIHNCDNRFFLDQFGVDIEQYTLADYHLLLENLTGRLRLNILNRATTIDDVPPVIRDLFTHGATLDNVQFFYDLPTPTLKKYKSACKEHKKTFKHRLIPSTLREQLALLSRDTTKLEPQLLVQLSSAYSISLPRLMREVIGEL